MVPVDGDSQMLVALVLLELLVDAVPVTGTQQDNPTAPGHHLFR